MRVTASRSIRALVNTSRGRSPADTFLAVGARRRARERALELLYEAEAKGLTPSEVLGALPIRPEQYAIELFEGVGANAKTIDELIESHTKSWSLSRLPVVDRQLLRLSTYELLAQLGVPIAVVIDEAVELAKQYSTDDSGSFVNGVLSAIAAELRETTDQ